MAQRSLPQAGSGVGDSGPYTEGEWAEYFQTVFTGDRQATQGPIRHYLNELEVTQAALAVGINTGAGFVYGHFLINDAAVTINVALAAAGLERYDRVVMVQNNTAAAYNTNLALPAAYAAGVPRNSARVAILQGAEAGAAVLPALLTGPNYYMVELARYFVNDAAVGTVTDYRDYCGLGTSGPSTQYEFVQVMGGYNISQGIAIPVTVDMTGLSAALVMPQDDLSSGSGYFTTPGNYLGTMVSRAVVTASTGGNIYASNWAAAGVCGGSPTASNDGTGPGYNVEAIVGSHYYNCVQTLNVSARSQGDIIRLFFTRAGNNVFDTVPSSVNLRGWLISYTTLT